MLGFLSPQEERGGGGADQVQDRHDVPQQPTPGCHPAEGEPLTAAGGLAGETRAHCPPSCGCVLFSAPAPMDWVFGGFGSAGAHDACGVQGELPLPAPTLLAVSSEFYSSKLI